MDEIKLHIESLDDFFGSALEMARRVDAGDLEPKPASLSFESMESLLRLLTPNRWTLLRKLRATGPSSNRALSTKLGRDYRGVHSDVSTLLDAGLIDRGEDGKIAVPWSRITAEMSVDVAA